MNSCKAWTLGLALLLLSPPVALGQGLAPKIEHEAVSQATAGKPLAIRARIVTATGKAVAGPAVLVRQAGLSGYYRLPMAPDTSQPDGYVAQIPREHVQGGLDYYLEARDEEGNGPGRAGSPEAPFHVVVTTLATGPTPEPAAPPAAVEPSPASPPPVPAAAMPAVAFGRLIVHTDPPGAGVTVDGVRVGESPLTCAVQAGVLHHVVIDAKGYVPVVTDVVVQEGVDSKADLKLVKDAATSRFLLRVTGSYALPGPFVDLDDSQRWFSTDDKFAVKEAYGANLTFTVVLAKYHGLTLDLGYAKLKLKSDRSDGNTVAKGSHFSAGLGYQLFLGPFSVVRPHLGILLGMRGYSLEEGDSSLGWKGGSGSRMTLNPMVDPELGIAFQLPAHILLDVSFRASCLDFGGPLMQLSGGFSLGAHF